MSSASRPKTAAAREKWTLPMPHEGDAAILRRYYPLKYAANVETINRLTRALMVSEAPVWIVPVLKEDIE